VESIGETREVSEAAKLIEDRAVLIGEMSGPLGDLAVASIGSSGGKVGDGWE
jgi:hypothetical protein